MFRMHFVDAKGILTGKNNTYGMNIYRGCSHGCIYCDSRSKCYNFTHPFEDIEVKQNAPELLDKALRSKRQKSMIGTGSMSDPYMHCEEKLRLTRKCLEIILHHGFGATVITKSDRIMRDMDRGVTQLTARGAYTGTERPTLLCVIGRSEIMALKRILREEDEKAFVIIVEAHEAIGDGFTHLTD